MPLPRCIPQQFPALPIFFLRKPKFQRPEMRIEDHIETVVDDRLILLVDRMQPSTVKEDPKRFRISRLPMVLRHFSRIRQEPRNISHAGSLYRTPLEPVLP